MAIDVHIVGSYYNILQTLSVVRLSQARLKSSSPARATHNSESGLQAQFQSEAWSKLSKSRVKANDLVSTSGENPRLTWVELTIQHTCGKM